MLTGKYMGGKILQLEENVLREIEANRQQLLSNTEPKFEVVHCPLCNHGVTAYLAGGEGQGQIGVCKKCGVVYAFERATESILKILYMYYVPSNLTNVEVRNSQEITRPAELNSDIDVIEKYTNRGHLLDIGASSGDFLVYSRLRGWKVEATELSNICAEFMSSILEIPVRVGNILDIEFEDNKYNAITLRHSVEHLRDPINELKALHKALTDDGVLLVTTPEHAKDLELIKKEHMLPLHLVNYTKDTLDLLFSKTGFRRVSYESQITSGSINNMRVVALKEEE